MLRYTSAGLLEMSDFRFVLHNPSNPKNIVAAARAVVAGGFGRVTIVSELEPANRSDFDWYPTLESACAHEYLIAGMTRRIGQKRKSAIPLEAFCERATEMHRRVSARAGTDAPGVAIVFGNEKSGLTDQDLASCNLAVNIPSNPEAPSLNLAHSVSLVAYRVRYFLNLLPKIRSPAAESDLSAESTPLTSAALRRATSGFLESIRTGGFLVRSGPQGMETFLRDILARGAMAAREARYLDLILRRIATP